ncbi:MAG TPA: PQQ-binding-like beta-propeller repeat protein, partial [Gemmatimonadaceae bacterium]|nr:PQQ-binding-like beta-propeller repeat protein [Gemmatimonadaceae bacterium]
MSFSRASILPVVAVLLGSAFVIAESRERGAPPAPETMFRGGPAHHGVYRGGGPTLLGLAWRAPTDGDVVSSPAIVGNDIFIGSGDGYLYALDLATGARRWRYDAGSPVSSSPAIGGGLVFAEARDGSVFAVDAVTGKQRWRITTGGDLPLPWGHESGDHFLSSPAYVDGTVVVGAGDGGVYALDATTGRRKWRAQTEGRVRGSPAVANGRVYAGSYDGRVYCYDLTSGALRWRYETEGVTLQSKSYGFDRRSIQSSPAVDNGVVYVGARDGFLYALGADDGKLRWRVDHKISWIITSPAVSEHIVFAGSSDAHFAQALDSTGAERWRFGADVPVWSSPAVAGDLVYFGDAAGRVHAIDRVTGKEHWMFRTGASVFSSPVVAGDLIVFGSTDGGVYALRTSNGPAIKRAVFFDTSYVKAATVRQPDVTARYFGNRGYQTLDAVSLARFLEERIADRAPSVVVFAVDQPPPAIVAAPLAQSLLRRYLDAGGKVVWPGKPPLIFQMDLATGNFPPLSSMNWSAPNELLGVPHDAAIFDVRGARATAAGLRIGLPARWRDSWSVAPSGVTTVLGLDEWGLAAAWIKRY